MVKVVEEISLNRRDQTSFGRLKEHNKSHPGLTKFLNQLCPAFYYKAQEMEDEKYKKWKMKMTGIEETFIAGQPGVNFEILGFNKAK